MWLGMEPVAYLLRIPYWEFDNVAELVENFVEATRTFNELFAPNTEGKAV